jgi:hypothetical protein
MEALQRNHADLISRLNGTDVAKPARKARKASTEAA